MRRSASDERQVAVAGSAVVAGTVVAQQGTKPLPHAVTSWVELANRVKPPEVNRKSPEVAYNRW